MKINNGNITIKSEFAGYYTETFNSNAYTSVLNPDKYSPDGLARVIALTIENSDVSNQFAIICSPYTNAADFINLGTSVVLLLDDLVVELAIPTINIVNSAHLDDFGTYFSIYKFLEGYIVYGELNIVRLSKTLKTIWSFSGADIFVTQDNAPAFILDNESISLRDWSGKLYVLNSDGKEQYKE
jgi:hypothetical protein